MKKIVSISLILILCSLVLVGCSKADSGSGSQDSTPPQVADSVQNQTDNELDEAEGGKTLVVYYSATGYTRAVAETIVEATDGDLFELVPTEIYSGADLDWRDENSRVCQEYADESLRAVPLSATTIENWDEYDTVFIGYPIWWGIAAWPVNGFIEANDFNGKTVIPFCTSSSSGLGDSDSMLAELAETGDWQEGKRFRSNIPTSDVVEWVESLEI